MRTAGDSSPLCFTPRLYSSTFYFRGTNFFGYTGDTASQEQQAAWLCGLPTISPLYLHPTLTSSVSLISSLSSQLQSTRSLRLQYCNIVRVHESPFPPSALLTPSLPPQPLFSHGEPLVAILLLPFPLPPPLHPALAPTPPPFPLDRNTHTTRCESPLLPSHSSLPPHFPQLIAPNRRHRHTNNHIHHHSTIRPTQQFLHHRRRPELLLELHLGHRLHRRPRRRRLGRRRRGADALA